MSSIEISKGTRLDTLTTVNNVANCKDSNCILLQTAQAIALNFLNEKSTVLFESGSQRTYITESLKARLNLKTISHERLNLNTFGNHNTTTQCCKVVQFFLNKSGSAALCFPVLQAICSTVDCPHLESLKLADVVITAPKSLTFLWIQISIGL